MAPIEVIEGNDTLNTLYNPTSQVFKATHNLEGGTWKRLSFMKRSFISFSYGGKFIEDFNLIAVINGDRLQRSIYGDFEDITTSYEVLDGQYYWGTHFTNNSLNFILATDGITEEKLNEFKKWFAPGQNKELFLSENPNRAILARVSSTPSYSLLPFEEKTTVTISGNSYNTSTTLYKGEINLEFIMDEPFWYSRASIIEPYYTDEEDKIGSMTYNATSTTKTTINDKDFLKIIKEDNIPYFNMIQNNAIFSDNMEIMNDGNGNSIINFGQLDTATIETILEEYNDSYAIDIDDTTTGYLYYSGTAPSKPIVIFTLTPSDNNGQSDYIIYPRNKYSSTQFDYNIITVGNKTIKFTTPSLYTGYNQAINIVKNFQAGESAYDVQTALKVGVNEYYSRAWALYCVDVLITNNIGVDSDTKAILSTFFNNFKIRMKSFIYVENEGFTPVTFLFNSNTGEAIGIFTVRVNNGNAVSNIQDNPLIEIIENVGDMLRSPYLILEERNYPNENGYITNAQCTSITTDCAHELGGLKNLLITYKNMYL